jgi:hypothetical protein
MYLTEDGKAWNHEFQSLAERELVAKKGRATAWAPDKPGIEFKPIPEAPRRLSRPPAASFKCALWRTASQQR